MVVKSHNCCLIGLSNDLNCLFHNCQSYLKQVKTAFAVAFVLFTVWYSNIYPCIVFHDFQQCLKWLF